MVTKLASSTESATNLPATMQVGAQVALPSTSQLWSVADQVLDVSLVDLDAYSAVSVVDVQNSPDPIIMRIAATTYSDAICAYLDANEEWSQAGVYWPSDAEIRASFGDDADLGGSWCASSHLSVFTILVAVAGPCEFGDYFNFGGDCFDITIVAAVIGGPIGFCCLCWCIICCIKCRRPTKGKMKLKDSKGSAQESSRSTWRRRLTRAPFARSGRPSACEVERHRAARKKMTW
ncbi:unnamed protein product [Effrenium voratum]|nr:unnamed protein product [Effrenium voratum]